jgi:PAS domain S-box-containing protein
VQWHFTSAGEFRPLSLLTRVVLIIAAALLPPLLMQAFNEATLRSVRQHELRQEAMHDARAIDVEVESILAGVRNALVATAAIPAVRTADAASCGTPLRTVLAGLTFLRELAVVDDAGRLVCGTDPASDRIRAGAASEIRLARARGEMALGGYTLGRDGNVPELPVAYPVKGAPGPGPVLIGAIDLGWLRQRLADGLLPEGASVTLADRNGIILVAMPDADLVGQPGTPAQREVWNAPTPAVSQDTDRHGISRVVATLPPDRTMPDLLVSVALSTDPALAEADAASTRGYALIGGGFLVALALATWMARGVIARPVQAILATTGRWQAGDTAARLPSTDPRSEFGRIATAINALLDAAATSQARLRERLAELRAIYEGSPVGLGYVGCDLRYVSVNARLAEINGLSAAAHRGRTVRDVLPALAHRIEPALTRALQGEAIAAVELQAPTEAAPGTPRRLLVSYQPAVAADRSVLGVVIAVQEITALREAEAALRTALERANADLEQRVAERTRQLEAEVREREAAQAQLQQAQKMEVIGQLTGGVAHDFNNLLTAIIGNLELAAARSRDRPEVIRLLAGAMRSADRGAALTQRMLAFGRRQFLRLQPVDIATLLVSMAEMIARTIGPSIRVHIETQPGLPPARADPNQVELIILNLVLNARDAMPEGGSITIAATAERVGTRAAHLGGPAPGDYVRLSVSDDGQGMDEATQARAFEPFFTTKPVGRGSGLGLPMVQGVVAQSDGAVSIHSVPGKGTTVTVWLPCAPEAPGAQAPLPEGGVANGGGTVLLVDDDADVVAFAATCLQEAGYAVQRACSGAEALDALRAGPAPDLLIADLGMPGMSGLQLAAAARRLHPQLRILIATGYMTDDTAECGALDLPVLNKPFKATELLGRVAGLVRPPMASPADAGATPGVPAPQCVAGAG